MASRSEEVFIILRAIGSAAARRQIDDVADALGRLNNETGTHADATKEDTTVTDKNTASVKKNAAATKQSDKVNREFTKGQEAMLNGLKRYAKGDIGLTKSRLDQFKARQKVDDMVKRANEKAIREQNIADKARERLIKSHQQVASKLLRDQEREANQIRAAALRGQRDFDRQVERDRKLQERALAKHLKEQERLEKASLKKRKSFKLPKSAGFQSPIRVAAVSSLIFGALDAVNFLATGLNAVAAGGIAAVNGLAPLSGMLVTLPAGMMAMAQASIVTKLAFNGMAKAIGGDAEALAKLPENARQFALGAMILKQTYTELQRSVQNTFFKGMGDEVLLLGNTYFPILNKRLNETARGLNRAAMNLSGWLRSAQGVKVVNDLMKSNSVVIENGAFAGNHLLESLLRIGRSAGPMMRLLSKDVRRVTNDLANWTQRNDKEITGFFNRSYKLFKRTVGVIGDYGIGIFNIFKQSDSLSAHIGKNVEATGKSFRKWTESEGGIKAMRTYFEEMKPNLDAVARLMGHLAKDIFDIGRSKNFADTVAVIDNELRPALKKIIQESDGKFLPALITVIKGIEVLAASGVIDTIADAMMGAAKVFLWVANTFSGLPQWTKEFIVWGLVFYGILARPLAIAIKLVTSIGKIGKLLAGLKVSKSLLAFLGMGAAGGGGAGAAGAAATAAGAAGAAGGGKASKGGKVVGFAKSGAGKALGAVSIVVTGAMLMQPLMDWISKVGGGSKGGGNAAGAVKTGNLNQAFQDTKGKNLVGGLFYKDIQNVDQALKKLGSNNAFTKLDNWAAKFTGQIGPLDKLKNAFRGLDGQMAKIKGARAANEFDKVRAAAVRQKFPMDKLIAMFPSYRDQVFKSGERAKIMGSKLYSAADKAQIMSGKLNGVRIPAGRAGEAMLNADRKARNLASAAKKAGDSSKTAGGKIGGVNGAARSAAGGMSSATGKAGGLRGAFNKVATAAKGARDWISRLASRAKSWLSSAAASDPNLTFNFAGGTVMPNAMSVVGEFGPEAAITRSGSLKMLGTRGPELFSPSAETAIIPSSATFDPGNGNYGQAPEWAKSMYQSKIESTSQRTRTATPIARNAEPKNDTMVSPQITITGNTITSNVDLDHVVRQAIMRYEREKRERR